MGFSKSCNVPILKICGVISDTYPSLKSLTKVMEDFFLRIIFSSHVISQWKYLGPPIEDLPNWRRVPGFPVFGVGQPTEKGFEKIPDKVFLILRESFSLRHWRDVKNQIEKRMRNMESTSSVSRREKRNVKICFLVREENENFCQKNGEILNIFSSFEMRREIQKYFL